MTIILTHQAIDVIQGLQVCEVDFRQPEAYHGRQIGLPTSRVIMETAGQLFPRFFAPTCYIPKTD